MNASPMILGWNRSLPRNGGGMCTGRLGPHDRPIRISWRTATVISRRHLLYQIPQGDPLDPRDSVDHAEPGSSDAARLAVVNVIGLQNMKPASGHSAVNAVPAAITVLYVMNRLHIAIVVLLRS